MKIQIIFGSQSDESIYSAIQSDLEKRDHRTDVKVLSAHRNPLELKALLSDLPPQPIIAGAGLAAHLPGVVASLVTYPVFGVPVKSVFQGLDAFLSIVQMPKGVPVACSFHSTSIADFLAKNNFEEKIYSTQTSDTNCELKDANILIANLEEHKATAFSGVRVLHTTSEEKTNPAFTLKWHEVALQTGLWVGINRLENAKIFLEKMRSL
ncbi:MAG: AIR carboxylase family protein [Bdellovibrionales bacterium]|nr:AIR carboxylase family protein [Bdellovibrionales bacterium]